MDKEPEIAAEKEPGHSLNWRPFILWPALILLLYILSAGPVMRMANKGIISNDGKFLAAFYKPWGWVYKQKLFHKPLGLYLHLWVPEWFDKNGEMNFPD